MGVVLCVMFFYIVTFHVRVHCQMLLRLLDFDEDYRRQSALLLQGSCSNSNKFVFEIVHQTWMDGRPVCVSGSDPKLKNQIKSST